MQGSATGTGTVTLLAPVTSTNRTLTLPDATDTVAGIAATQTLTNKTLTTPNIDSAQFATVSGTAPIYPCRAWVNFNGTGTVAIRASGNVSSITDHGTGEYTVNFSTAMPDANYTTVAQTSSDSGTSLLLNINSNSAGNTTPTTTATRMFTNKRSDGAATDPPYVNVSIFR